MRPSKIHPSETIAFLSGTWPQNSDKLMKPKRKNFKKHGWPTCVSRLGVRGDLAQVL